MGGIGGPLVMRYALLFPGQGAQAPGMGKDVAETVPAARAVFDAADDALEESISRVCFEGTADELALTENTQPAILTVSVACLRALQDRGIPAPAAAAGHSLGEYSAHVAAGTIEFDDAVRTVRARGRFMQEAVPVGAGAMAAIIGLDADVVDTVCADAAAGDVVSPANLNSPGQVVIAGDTAAVERAVAIAKERGAKRALPLPVSAPFHCARMEPAAERLLPVLRAIPFRDPGYPVITNVDALAVTAGDPARDALYRQVASPVRWIEVMQAMIADGIDTFVEVGPGKVLSGLARRIDRSVSVHAVSDPDGVDGLARAFGETK